MCELKPGTGMLAKPPPGGGLVLSPQPPRRSADHCSSWLKVSHGHSFRRTSSTRCSILSLMKRRRLSVTQSNMMSPEVRRVPTEFACRLHRAYLMDFSDRVAKFARTGWHTTCHHVPSRRMSGETEIDSI